ncbi:metalloregulator ArsR/SmtB family transcription factor [Actinoplanes sp. HUAS TT8]|uniref:metalloregulator ArsR/SmtB family transcription factor n=1 Tax=Actinoplanes sp. HUAS TT8 TaxID=3447453 RepID=UPI003F521706
MTAGTDGAAGRVAAAGSAPGPAVDAVALRRAVEVLRGMAYEHRLHILVILGRAPSTPADLAATLNVHSTVVSHHMRDLVHAGLVRRRRLGRNVFYALADDAVATLVGEALAYARADPRPR